MVTITIHCKPYVAHWLRERFANANGTIALPRKSTFRQLFLACLAKQFQPAKSRYVKQLPATVEVRLSKHDIDQHGIAIDPALMFFVNGVIEERIKHLLYHEVNVYRYQVGMSLAESLKHYQRKHNFSEEVFPLGTIQRAYYVQAATAH